MDPSSLARPASVRPPALPAGGMEEGESFRRVTRMWSPREERAPSPLPSSHSRATSAGKKRQNSDLPTRHLACIEIRV